MRLIDPLDLGRRRLLVDHIDISIISPVCPSLIEYKHSPIPLRQGEFYIASVIIFRQVDHFLMEDIPFRIPHSQDRIQLIIFPLRIVHRIPDLPESDGRLQHPAHIQAPLISAPENIRRRARQIQLFPLRVLLFDQPVCVSRRKMLVVQNPQLHTLLFRFIQDDIHVMPPARPAEIVVGTCFQAYGPNPALIDLLHLFPEDCFLLAAHPQKRQNIIVFHIRFFSFFESHASGYKHKPCVPCCNVDSGLFACIFLTHFQFYGMIIMVHTRTRHSLQRHPDHHGVGRFPCSKCTAPCEQLPMIYTAAKLHVFYKNEDKDYDKLQRRPRPARHPPGRHFPGAESGGRKI